MQLPANYSKSDYVSLTEIGKFLLGETTNGKFHVFEEGYQGGISFSTQEEAILSIPTEEFSF